MPAAQLTINAVFPAGLVVFPRMPSDTVAIVEQPEPGNVQRAARLTVGLPLES